jgi:hypothetical protein
MDLILLLFPGLDFVPLGEQILNVVLLIIIIISIQPLGQFGRNQSPVR